MKNTMRQVLTSALCCGGALAATAQEKPNIILFMVDDMGWQDTSLPFWTERTHFNDVFETPNMERLAAKGMMFTQAYASSVSSPTRCSLFTGANAARHRVTNWTLEKGKTTDHNSKTINVPNWNFNGLSQVEGIDNTFHALSFVDLLKRAGYHTIHCGKAHLGAIDTPGEDPIHFGFEKNIAGHAAGGPASFQGTENYGHDKNGKPWNLFAIPGLEKYWGTDTFLTEALTIEAIDAMDRSVRMEQPFFLYMAHYAVHVPINKDSRFYQKYIDKGYDPREAAYAALVEGMDKSLGDIMDWLEEKKIDDNTIILFMSDNGGLSCEGFCRAGEVHQHNYPLNSGKGSAYEGGVREPMIVSWPGKVEENTKCNDYLLIEDFYPTILEMGGVKKYDVPQQIDGVSFMPLLTQTGSTPKNRALIWNMPNIWGPTGPGIGATCAIRKGDWKLIYYYETGKKELFNIANDISEKENQAAANPKLVAKLSKELGKKLRKMDGQRPTFKANGEPCPWPDEI